MAIISQTADDRKIVPITKKYISNVAFIYGICLPWTVYMLKYKNYFYMAPISYI